MEPPKIWRIDGMTSEPVGVGGETSTTKTTENERAEACSRVSLLLPLTSANGVHFSVYSFWDYYF